MRALLVAALLTGAFAGAVHSEPEPPPEGGPCHVYWKPSTLDLGIPGVPNPPGTPFVICDY